MASKIKDILVLLPMQDKHRKLLENAAPGAIVRMVRRRELQDSEISNAQVIIGNLEPEQLAKVKSAHLLQLNSAGVPPYYLSVKETLPGAVLCCASGAYGEAIAEHALAMLLMLMKRLHLYRDDQPTGAWADHGNVKTVAGMNVLVVGLGDIGGQFARLCNALGATVRGIRRRSGPAPVGVEAVYTQADLHEQLAWAEAVLLSLPETEDTRSVLDQGAFASMQKGTYVLNVGRGSAIDQSALMKALDDGIVAGAGLDVTTPEPLPSESPLWHHKNVLITPHVSGGLHAQRTHDSIFAIAAHNISALPEGPFRSRVDFTSGYRA